METGHLVKWDANSGGDKIHDNDWDGPVVLTVEHISGGLVIYTIAMTLALLAFIGERWAYKNIMKENNRVWKWLDKFIFSTERIIWRNEETAEIPTET